MAYTRTDAEKDLVSRAKQKMALVGFAVTTDGNNADLDTPITTALRKMGKVLGDLATMTDLEIDEFLDRAELRLLENIAGNIDVVDITVGPEREAKGQLADQVEKAIDRLSKSIKSEFGAGLQELQAGLLTLDFQETNDELE